MTIPPEYCFNLEYTLRGYAIRGTKFEGFSNRSKQGAYLSLLAASNFRKHVTNLRAWKGSNMSQIGMGVVCKSRYFRTSSGIRSAGKQCFGK